MSCEPFLWWAGGKRQLLPELRKYVPKKMGTHHEPFAGGAALFFDTTPQSSVLADTNRHLIETYCEVRDNPHGLIEELGNPRFSNDEEHYYDVRRWSPTLRVERAARFLFLNRTCFNGLYRENSSGQFNVPFGRYKLRFSADSLRQQILDASLALRSTLLCAQSFEQAEVSPGDFVYLDPPYWPVSATAKFTQYSAGGFSAAKQVQLRDKMIEWSGAGANCLASNADVPEVRELYAGFKLVEVQARRAINSNGEKRGKVGELLIMAGPHYA